MALQPIQRGYKGFQGQTVAPNTMQPVFTNERTQLLQSLGKFASVGAQLGEAHVQKVIEADKIQQADRAAQDLLVSAKERQGITEDSTVAGQLAYNAIIGQHDTANASNNFVEWYSANADADEDTIASKKQELFSPLLDKYGTDARTLKQVSLQVQEAQFALAPAQERILQDHRSKKAEEAVRISVGDMLANPAADVDSLVDKEIPSRAKAMGMDEFTYKQLLLGEAAARAENGDARMLKALQSRDWSKGSAVLSRAENAYEQYVAKENAVLIGNSMADIEAEALSLGVPWATTMRKIQEMNNRFPDTYSAERVASLKIQQGNARKKAATDLEMQRASSAPLVDEGAVPFGLNNLYTPKQKLDHIKKKEAEWAAKGQYLKSVGMPEASANAAIQKEMLDWSRVNRAVVPGLKASMDAVINLNLDDTSGPKLEDYQTTGVAAIQSMDDSMIGLYFSGEEKTMAINLKAFMGNRTPQAAFKLAYDARRRPLSVTSDARANQELDADDAAGDYLDAKWYQLGKNPVPEAQAGRLRGVVKEEAMTLLYGRGLDTKANAKTAAATVLSRYSQTFNNTMINKTQGELAQLMNLKDGGQVNRALEGFVLKHKSDIEEEIKRPLNLDELEFRVSDNGTTMTIHDLSSGAAGGGEQIGGRFLMQDVGEVGMEVSNEFMEEMRGRVMKETDADRKRREEQRQMGLLYLEGNPNRLTYPTRN